MPELPEVETVKRKLAQILPGKKIFKLEILKPRSFWGNPKILQNQEILAVKRQAKLIYFELSKQNYLITHLKMTGQLIYLDNEIRLGGGHPTADWIKELPSSHTRLVYHFCDGSNLFFNDQRIFGWMKLVDRLALEQELAKYAPDINSPQLQNSNNLKKLINKIKTSKRAIKQVLLDSKIVSGLGNIYVCEALFLAKIHPSTPANTLSEQKLFNLIKKAQEVVELAISLGGTTYDGKYVHVDGMSGQMQNKLNVYGRDNQPCQVCGEKISKIKIGGRGTWFCPQCQR